MFSESLVDYLAQIVGASGFVILLSRNSAPLNYKDFVTRFLAVMIVFGVLAFWKIGSSSPYTTAFDWKGMSFGFATFMTNVIFRRLKYMHWHLWPALLSAVPVAGWVLWIVLLAQFKDTNIPLQITAPVNKQRHRMFRLPSAAKIFNKTALKTATCAAGIAAIAGAMFSIRQFQEMDMTQVMHVMILFPCIGFALGFSAHFVWTYPHAGWRRLAIVVSPLIAIFAFYNKGFYAYDGYYQHQEFERAFCSVITFFLSGAAILIVKDISLWVAKGFANEATGKVEKQDAH